MAFADAIKAHKGFEHLEDHVERLDALEKLIFPQQLYFSMGTIVRRKVCSICKDDYVKCDHISGRPYWGEFCHTNLEDVVVDHVAIVPEAANKRCRVTHFDDGEGRRNTMTWRVEQKLHHTDDNAARDLTTTGSGATVSPRQDGVQSIPRAQ
jgi:hypothetical protein